MMSAGGNETPRSFLFPRCAALVRLQRHRSPSGSRTSPRPARGGRIHLPQLFSLSFLAAVEIAPGRRWRPPPRARSVSSETEGPRTDRARRAMASVVRAAAGVLASAAAPTGARAITATAANRGTLAARCAPTRPIPRARARARCGAVRAAEGAAADGTLTPGSPSARPPAQHLRRLPVVNLRRRRRRLGHADARPPARRVRELRRRQGGGGAGGSADHRLEARQRRHDCLQGQLGAAAPGRPAPPRPAGKPAEDGRTDAAAARAHPRDPTAASACTWTPAPSTRRSRTPA